MLDLEKLKEESWKAAIAELKREYSENIKILKKIEDYEKKNQKIEIKKGTKPRQ